MVKLIKSLQPKFQPKFEKQFKKLHPVLKKKFSKQLSLLLKNPRHPSLNINKMSGFDLYEARLDKHNRFVYGAIDDEIWFYTIGPHDEGLGRK